MFDRASLLAQGLKPGVSEMLIAALSAAPPKGSNLNSTLAFDYLRQGGSYAALVIT
jgi:hypothetical protein